MSMYRGEEEKAMFCHGLSNNMFSNLLDSGKTYTIEGGTQNDKKGIIPRATELIFSHIHT